jgi:hypothetical protein
VLSCMPSQILANWIPKERRRSSVFKNWFTWVSPYWNFSLVYFSKFFFWSLGSSFFFEKPNWITVRAVAISVLSQWMFVLARDISEQRKRKEILDETQKQDSKKSWVENW